MPFSPAKPYNDLPLLPPETEIETKATLRASAEARAALAELKAAGGMIPNQSVIINSIPILEAQASSAIENIVTTTDKLFRYADHQIDQADPDTKEAFQYRTALYEGFKEIKTRPLSVGTCIRTCAIIKGADLGIRKTPGTALQNKLTGEVVYTPPEGETLILEKLSNWEKFLHESDVEPLIRMAALHYQFEAIHPFIDGNGRTGRVLNLLFLVQHGLLEIPVLYLSRHIIKNKADYYRLLGEVTANNAWEPWILYMLAAVRETATWTREKIVAIKLLIDSTANRVREAEPRIYSRELIELIFEQPYCRISTLVNKGIAKRQAASTYLTRLEELGVLERAKAKGAEKVYANPKFLALLKSGNALETLQTVIS
ncbi:MAG TPA: Fic family protein [Caulobacterales bacterium]|nr:Fic family protein [Caulobacterales bacterium]